MEGSTLPLDARDVLYVCTEDLARVLDVWFALCVYSEGSKAGGTCEGC